MICGLRIINGSNKYDGWSVGYMSQPAELADICERQVAPATFVRIEQRPQISLILDNVFGISCARCCCKIVNVLQHMKDRAISKCVRQRHDH